MLWVFNAAPHPTHGVRLGVVLLFLSSLLFFFCRGGQGVRVLVVAMSDFICSGLIPLLPTFFLGAVEVANEFSIVFPVCIWIVLICFWMVDEVILWSIHLQGAVMDLGQCFSTLASRYR